jgi:FMN phosphatase YigB (HAD superfamily)
VLRGLGLRLAIGSNFDERLHCVVQDCAALGDFTAGGVFDSAALGWRKPAQPFFQAIEARLDLPPDALLMVGDDAQNDLAGAQASGWQAFMVGPERRAVGPASDLAEMAECLAAALA